MGNNRLLRKITILSPKEQDAAAQCREWAPRPGQDGQTSKDEDPPGMSSFIRRGTDRWSDLMRS
jgi:hypothetical protein